MFSRTEQESGPWFLECPYTLSERAAISQGGLCGWQPSIFAHSLISCTPVQLSGVQKDALVTVFTVTLSILDLDWRLCETSRNQLWVTMVNSFLPPGQRLQLKPRHSLCDCVTDWARSKQPECIVRRKGNTVLRQEPLNDNDNLKEAAFENPFTHTGKFSGTYGQLSENRVESVQRVSVWMGSPSPHLFCLFSLQLFLLEGKR